MRSKAQCSQTILPLLRTLTPCTVSIISFQNVSIGISDLTLTFAIKHTQATLSCQDQIGLFGGGSAARFGCSW